MVTDDLFERIKSADGAINLPLVEKAYEFAKRAHEGQKRYSGEPFIIHPVEVAKIVGDLQLDTATIGAALLHDVVEDCNVTLEQIRREFGSEIAVLVDGVTKLSTISRKQELGETEIRLAREEEHFENLRRIFVAMAKDIRVIIIKLADRLHNLRTLCNLSLEKQRIIGRETLEIYAPLAHRLGMWKIKGELEDLAFSYLEPERYQDLAKQVEQQWVRRESEIKLAVETITQRLEAAGIHAKIEGRPKHLYSIFRKMAKKEKRLEEIHDITAVRILLDTVEDCYACLGVIHGLWMPLQDRIKDYIAKPKSNHYQSLHTTVYGPGGHPLEIQIRTWEMHRTAEYGVAAHWHYKQATKDKILDKMLDPWISQLKEWQIDLKSAREYVQAFTMDFLKNQVFAFSPKGAVLDLPEGSTPLDFAYRVHTDVGNHCVGAKVNGKMVPLHSHLQSGDIVEILVNKSSAGPSWDWLEYCKTSAARHKIKAWFKKEKRGENIERGKNLLEKYLPKIRLEPSLADLSKEAMLDKLAEKFHFARGVDFLDALGCGEVNLQFYLEKLREEKKQRESREKPKRLHQAILVTGMDQILVHLSQCCNPVPGDPISGYITLGKGVSVHERSCPNMKALLRDRPDRVTEVSWNKDYTEGTFYAEVEVDAQDRPGLLADILEQVYAEDLTAKSCRASANKDRALIRLTVEISNSKRLQELMKRVEGIRAVTEVRRSGRSPARIE